MHELNELGVVFHKEVSWRSNACTAEKTYDRTKDDQREWFHPDARPTGPQRDGYPCGDLVEYECPYCGLLFDRELAQ
jgi:hypothetical protein